MLRYRLRTFPCDTADMISNTFSILFPIRKECHPVPLHTPDTPHFGLFALFAYFFSPESGNGPPRNGCHGVLTSIFYGL